MDHKYLSTVPFLFVCNVLFTYVDLLHKILYMYNFALNMQSIKKQYNATLTILYKALLIILGGKVAISNINYYYSYYHYYYYHYYYYY